MKAQIDENLPPALARALNVLVAVDGHEVVHVTDYARGAPDLELFRRAIEDGVRVHITQDHHYRRPVEREAITRLGLTVFVLAKGWNHLGHYDRAARLIEYWPKIATTSENFEAGSIFRIPPRRNGKLELIKR
ncbi:DUF5615 family PIN-like protein [Luteimonas sp. RD2P54]|uniref:DUF5615 family PIN-like protein n=1 Tax=Luteimonas endophytica TaxID=3042023 RepID=A0ABT6J6X2_9GAMM|nr:DUF5615 family PIN-like protein [Luteimonas endophytica]MDH5822499.1 DUF5615 family PIN-like protein [Luteimonas endophytica]